MVYAFSGHWNEHENDIDADAVDELDLGSLVPPLVPSAPVAAKPVSRPSTPSTGTPAAIPAAYPGHSWQAFKFIGSSVLYAPVLATPRAGYTLLGNRGGGYVPYSRTPQAGTTILPRTERFASPLYVPYKVEMPFSGHGWAFLRQVKNYAVYVPWLREPRPGYTVLNETGASIRYVPYFKTSRPGTTYLRSLSDGTALYVPYVAISD